MAAITLAGNALNKAEMESNGKFGYTLGRIHHIALMSRLGICYTSCHLSTQTVAPTLPSFQCIKLCIQYMASHPHKPILYPSNYYYGSNVIRLTWSGNQVEDYTTHKCLEYHQYADDARILNRKRSVSGIIHTLLSVAVCWKVRIQPDISSDCTDG